MAGWIKLHRELTTKAIYQQSPLYLRVFERLLLEANSKCKRIPYGKGEKLIKRGEKLTSIGQIAEWVGWYERGIFRVPNKKTISVILDWLLENELIEIFNKGNARETHYNIVNYCVYQNKDDYESNAKVTPTGHKQEVKERKETKEDKDIKKSSKVFSDESIPYRLAVKLRGFIFNNNPESREPDLQKWALEFDRLINIDKKQPIQIYEVMEWSQNHKFWKTNILSPKKLREQYPTLLLQKQEEKPKKQTNVEKAMERVRLAQQEELTGKVATSIW